MTPQKTKCSDFIESKAVSLNSQVLLKICLLLIIQYPLNSNSIGAHFRSEIAFTVNFWSRAGGSTTIWAKVILSQIHAVKRLTAAIGKRIGMPTPYIIVTYTTLTTPEYLKWII